MKRIIIILLGACSLNLFAQPLPSESSHQHLGAASCAGSACHSAGSPSNGARVQMNEFTIWQRQDAHSRAYKAVQSESGLRIAQNLGLKSSTDAMCLSCHTDSVRPAQQGKRYRESEGVSCEACHGGSEKWLGPHATGLAQTSELTQAGMYPLSDSTARAKLCLTCHQSSAKNPAHHRLFGAGHPPLNRFELDTYTATQPAHFRIDADYLKRKSVHSSARTWVTGQISSADIFLAEIQSSAFTQHGTFPELSFYDCDSCHHPMKNLRWTSAVGGDSPAGQPRISDVSLTMVGIALSALSPIHHAAWQAELQLFRKAAGESVVATKASAQKLQAQLAALQKLLMSKEPTTGEIRAMLLGLVQDAENRSSGSYIHAAQTTMAIGALLADNSKGPATRKSVDALFAATSNASDYNPKQFRGALAGVKPLIP